VRLSGSGLADADHLPGVVHRERGAARPAERAEVDRGVPPVGGRRRRRGGRRGQRRGDRGGEGAGSDGQAHGGSRSDRRYEFVDLTAA
jgi:hypothetical protein